MFNSQKINNGQVPHPTGGNTPNLLLIAFREAVTHSVTGRTLAEIAAEWLESPLPKFLTQDQVSHARKVLERLGALA